MEASHKASFVRSSFRIALILVSFFLIKLQTAWAEWPSMTIVTWDGISNRVCNERFVKGTKMIAYLPETEQEASDAFQAIVDLLVIAKDGADNFYLPAQNFNNLPTLRQGRGYPVKVSQDAELIWNLP